jgi:hypothetical protein
MSPAVAEETVYWFQPEIFILGILRSPDWPWLTCKTTYSLYNYVIIHMCATLFPVFILQASVLTFPYCYYFGGSIYHQNVVLIAGALVVAGKVQSY